MLLVRRIHRAEDVEVDVVLAQHPPAVHHLVERAAGAAVEPVGVVDLSGPVTAQPHQEVVLLEEFTPLVVEQDAVGLEGVLHHLVGPAVLLDQFDSLAEELHPHQRRLATLPGDGDGGGAVGLQQLPDVGLQRGLRHPALVVRVQGFLGQEEAVRAVDVACRTAGLRKEVEPRRRVRRPVGGECAGHGHTSSFNLAMATAHAAVSLDPTSA